LVKWLNNYHSPVTDYQPKEMNNALKDLIKISNATGRNVALVQAGGGNTSVKTADGHLRSRYRTSGARCCFGKYMYIKASGTALKDMSIKRGWRRLRLDVVLSIIEDKSIAKLDTQARETEVKNRLLLACDDKISSQVRPSLESHFHAILDKCVVHLHPQAVLAYTCAKNGREKLQKLFKNEKFPPVWVPYVGLGYMLAKKIKTITTDYKNHYGRKPAIIFLQNHGLAVTANSADAVLRLVHKVVRTCNGKLKQLKSLKVRPVNSQTITNAKLCIRRAFFKATGRHTSISYFYNETIAAFWRQTNAKKMLSSGVLTPDELLYANGPAMWVDKCDSTAIAAELSSQIRSGLNLSVAFLVKGVGLFVAASEKIAPAINEIVTSSLFIRTNAFRLGGIHGLNKKQQHFIKQWETDAFRRKLAGG
jgi:rhamnose utilization protein RhaD (predicted bifunctional aldolase and dehydrogenase)